MIWKLSEIRISRGDYAVDVWRNGANWYWRQSSQCFPHNDGFAMTMLSALWQGIKAAKSRSKEGGE